MIIKLFDKTEIVVSEREAEAVVKAVDKGSKLIRVKGFVIAPGAIAMIKPGGYAQSDVIAENRRLDRPDFRGMPSPAKEKLRKKMSKSLSG